MLLFPHRDGMSPCVAGVDENCKLSTEKSHRSKGVMYHPPPRKRERESKGKKIPPEDDQKIDLDIPV